ncbi:hypothetical protein KSP35_21610 [Aquihabitans sp. G128]|uniref:hypothetical protein n=1 Tax=Aquihabitans sp. G128 TaxID=2849779 RepID=UPI001C21BFC4|nr:hypothetical protein [Aquihabitans sp. G128]QXC60883.1 hypothetical protein KSP35_21610 [Aquihabitans sp. G128]
MSAIQDQVLTLTTTVGAVLATGLVALLGWGPQIPLDTADTPPEGDRRSDGDEGGHRRMRWSR